MAGSGFALWQARGTLPGSQHANMMPQAAQGGATYQIYRVDLDVPAAELRRVVVRPDEGPQGPARLVEHRHERDLRPRLDPPDRARATAPRSAACSGAAWAARVTLRATHAQSGDVIQIYPEGITAGAHFPDNSFLDWDYGYLPPGTWTITAQGSGAPRTVTLNIDAAPVVSVLDPDVEGGRDFATTVIGDAWDLTNVQDVQRNHAGLHHLTSATFDETGLLGVTRGGSYASGCAADTCPDPFVQFLDDGFGFGPPVIDANTYHRLSFTLDYDHHELMIGAGDQQHLGRRRARRVGGIRRHRLHAVHHHAGHRRHRRRPDALSDGPGVVHERARRSRRRSPRCGRAGSARSASTSTRARRRAPSASPTSGSPPTTRRTAAASSRSAGASPTPRSRPASPTAAAPTRRWRSTTTPTSTRRPRR